MGLFDKKWIVKIQEEDLKDAKLSSTGYEAEDLKKRAFADVLAARLAMKMLFAYKIEATNMYSMYTIHKILEDVDIADISLTNMTLDARLVFDDENIFIPKSHKEFDIEPDVYLVLKLAQDFSQVECIGYIETKNINMEDSDNKYYYVKREDLQPVKSLKNLVKKAEVKIGYLPSESDINKSKDLLVSYIDEGLGYEDKSFLIQQLRHSTVLREFFVEFENFEVLSKNVGKNSEILEDGTLEFVAAQKVFEEDNKNELDEEKVVAIDATMPEEEPDVAVDGLGYEATEQVVQTSGFPSDTSKVVLEGLEVAGSVVGGIVGGAIAGATVAGGAASAAEGVAAIDGIANVAEGVANVVDSIGDVTKSFDSNVKNISEQVSEIDDSDLLENLDEFGDDSVEQHDNVEIADEISLDEIDEIPDENDINEKFEQIEKTDDVGFKIEDLEEDELDSLESLVKDENFEIQEDLDDLVDEKNDDEIVDNFTEEENDVEIVDDLVKENIENETADDLLEENNDEAFSLDELSPIEDSLDEIQNVEEIDFDINNEEKSEDSPELEVLESISDEKTEDDISEIASATDEDLAALFLDEEIETKEEPKVDEVLEKFVDIEQEENVSEKSEKANEVAAVEKSEENENLILEDQGSFVLDEISSLEEIQPLEEIAPENETEKELEEGNLSIKDETSIEPIEANAFENESVEDLAELKPLAATENEELSEDVLEEAQENDDDLFKLLDDAPIEPLQELEEPIQEIEASNESSESSEITSDGFISFDKIGTSGATEDTIMQELAELEEDTDIETPKEVEKNEDESSFDDLTSQIDEIVGDDEINLDEIDDVDALLNDISLVTGEISEPVASEAIVDEVDSSTAQEPVVEETQSEPETNENLQNLYNDDETLKMLFEAEKVKEEEKIQQNEKKVSFVDEILADKKKTIIAASVAGALLIGVIAATTIKPKNEVPQSDIAQQTQNALPVPEQDGMPSGGNMPAQGPNDLQSMNVGQAPSRDMGQAVSDAFSSTPVNASVSKIAWEVPEDLAYNDAVRKYLQLAGKSLKLSLQNDLLVANDMAYSPKIVLDIKIDKTGSVKATNVTVSSGSAQIDKIVLQSVKDTMKYLKFPQDELKGQFFDATLIINF